MRFPRVRFTVRRLMIAVAVVALGLGSVLLMRRRAHFQGISDHHTKMARDIRSSRASMIRPDGAYVHIPLAPLGRADYHRDMAEKYQRAARVPWLPVEPDPPEPE